MSIESISAKRLLAVKKLARGEGASQVKADWEANLI
jgi:hypothetical protein